MQFGKHLFVSGKPEQGVVDSYRKPCAEEPKVIGENRFKASHSLFFNSRPSLQPLQEPAQARVSPRQLVATDLCLTLL